MAAAGFPWRKIRTRFFLCSAWSTSSERCALACASEVFTMLMTNMTKIGGAANVRPFGLGGG